MHHSTTNPIIRMTIMTTQYHTNTIRYLPFAEGGKIFLDTLKELVVGIAGLLTVYSQRSAARRAIASMDSRMLSDIGLSPQQAFDEAEKPFWVA